VNRFLLFILLFISLESYSQINMISWNIQMRPEVFFPKENKIYRLESINNYLQIYDIVLLQESFEENSFKFITNGFEHIIYPSKNNSIVSNGLLIMSKIKIDFYDIIHFKDCSGFDCLSSKGSVIFQITKNSEKLLIINTHLQSDEGDKNEKIRKNQIKEISDLIEKYRKNDHKIILMGDMNELNNIILFENISNLKNCNFEGSTWQDQLLDYCFSNFDFIFKIEDSKLSDHLPITVLID